MKEILEKRQIKKEIKKGSGGGKGSGRPEIRQGAPPF